MPKRIVILDPNGIEVAKRDNAPPGDMEPDGRALWDWEWGFRDAAQEVCKELAVALKRENPKLGTYTVTVKEVE